MLLTANLRVVLVGVRQRAVVRNQSHSKMCNYRFPHKSALALDLLRVARILTPK